MPRLKRLSSEEVIKFLQELGFELVSQRGSHIKIVREMPTGKQVLVIPESNELPTGTLKAIYRQAKDYISEDDLRKYFYTE
jgi:predicted RNA binding protein YcfA (HicA-like mRNA interferase family)